MRLDTFILFLPKANMLIRNDIIGLKRISIDIAKKIGLVPNCRIYILISKRHRLQSLIKKILNIEIMTILPYTKSFVLVLPFSLLDD